MTSRTWPVLIFGFGSLVLLIALAGLGASRRARQIQDEIITIYTVDRETGRIFRKIDSDIQLSGVLVRDYLLDPSHLTADLHRRRLIEIRAGMAKQLQALDKVIATIKKSKDKDEAKVNLIKKFKLSDIQSVAILEMRLQQLANLERQKIEDELKEKKAIIKELQSILASEAKILGIVKTETEEIKEKYGEERRTLIVSHGVKEFTTEDLVPNEPTIVMTTTDGLH